jgi:hypothetical protein
MKSISTFASIVALTVSLVAVTGCDKSFKQVMKENGQVQTQAQIKHQAAEDALVEYQDEWQAFRIESDKQIAANVKSMDDLKARVAAADAKSGTRLSATLETLSGTNTALLEKLDGYQDDGKLSWDMFRRDFSRDLAGLDRDLTDLKTAIN